MTSPELRDGRLDGASPWNAAWRAVLPAYLVTRGAIVLVGVAAIGWWGIDTKEAAPNFQPYKSSIAAVEMWLHYDASWYLAIATTGYAAPVASDYDMRPAFFPAFPALVATVAAVLGSPVAAGLLVSNLACLAFLLCTWMLVAEDLGRRVATRAVWVLMLFPSSFYLSGIYTESTMLAAVAICATALRRRLWWVAALAAGTATLARTVGPLVFIPAAWECWQSPAPPRTRLAALGGIAVTMAAALGGWAWFHHVTFGDPFYVAEVQGWYRGPTTWPWVGFQAWLEAPVWHGYANSTMDAALALLALGCSALLFWKWNPGYALYALLTVLVPLSSGLVSFSRLMLAAFPCFVALALLIERRGVRIAWFVASAVLLVVLTARYATWRWVA